MPPDLILFMRWLGLLEAPAIRVDHPRGRMFRPGEEIDF